MKQIIPETAKAYIAGIFDGEGCFGFYSKTRGGAGRRGKKYYISVQLNMYDPEPFLLINKYYGFKLKKRPPKRKGYVMTLRSEDTKDFLEDIIPYLLHKQKQALLLLEIMNYKKNYNYTQKKEAAPFYELKEKECKEMKNIYTQLESLNNSKEIDLSKININDMFIIHNN